MAIYVTGDTHHKSDIEKLHDSVWFYENEIPLNDYVIICGDCGALWFGDERDKSLLDDFYSKLNCKVLFVDGNHENFNALERYDVEVWNGGRVHKIRENIYHLMRGQVYNIEGITIFTFGGAKSIDKTYRKFNVDWWQQEMPNEIEYQSALNNLAKVGYKVDYVLSHCAATSTIKRLNLLFGNDELTDWFEELEKRLEYKHWYFGHYHMDIIIDDKHTCLYNWIVKIDE